MLLTLLSPILLASAAPGQDQYVTDGKRPLESDVKMKRIERVTSEMDPIHVIKCRNVKEVGSRVPLRICRTLAEWTEIDRVNEESLQERRRNAGQIGADAGIIRSM